MASYNEQFLDDIKMFFKFRENILIRDYSTDLMFLLDERSILESIEESIYINIVFDNINFKEVSKFEETKINNLLQDISVLKINIRNTSDIPELENYIEKFKRKDLSIKQYEEVKNHLSWHKDKIVTLDSNDYNSYLVRLTYNSEINQSNPLITKLYNNRYYINNQIIYKSCTSLGVDLSVGRFKKTIPTGRTLYFIIPKSYYESNPLVSDNSEDGSPILSYINDESFDIII